MFAALFKGTYSTNKQSDIQLNNVITFLHDSDFTEVVVNTLDSDESDKDIEPQIGECHIGDQVSAPRLYGLYNHHGVLVENRNVLHVNAGPFSSLEVCLGIKPAVLRVDSVELFVKDPSRLLALESRSTLDNVECVTALTKKEGDLIPYHILFNNCEHYAEELTGKMSPQSHQVHNALIFASLGATLIIPPMYYPVSWIMITSLLGGTFTYTQLCNCNRLTHFTTVNSSNPPQLSGNTEKMQLSEKNIHEINATESNR